MKFTLSWLKEHFKTSATITEIRTALTRLGLEVESVQEFDHALHNCTVVHILKVEQHKHVNRLIVCQVDTGSGLLQIICESSNVRVGMKSLLGRPGTISPFSGKLVKEETINGIKSQGILYTDKELLLGDLSNRVLELPADAPIGATAFDVLTLDPVLEVVVTPNRPDCLGVQGIARELAAAGLGMLRILPTVPVPGTYTCPLTIIRAAAAEMACPMFVGRLIRGVQNGPSPMWLQRRLLSVGLRSVSALVDITNLLCLDAARPLHVFDADKLKGSLTVRLAQEGETLPTIDNKTYSLHQDMLIIADDTGPQALAGLIGGTAAACSESTVNVFLEAALFEPTLVSRTGRKLAIESEARYRFERGIDPAAVTSGAERATRLILDLCGGDASTLVISGTEPAWQRTLCLRLEHFRRLTGFDLPVVAMQHFLNAVGCIVDIEGENVLTVTPPSWRRDLEAEHNLIEEIIRLHGYHKVPPIPLPLPSVPASTGLLTPIQKKQSQIRRTLAARGMLEIITWSFMSSINATFFSEDRSIALANPMSADLDTLRPSLLPNLILAARYNAAHGMPDSALFEIGPQFHGKTPGAQKLIAAGIRTGYTRQRHWRNPSPRLVDVFDAKADAMAITTVFGISYTTLHISKTCIPHWYHPGRSGVLQLGSTVLGWFGEIHPYVMHALEVQKPLVCFEIVLDRLLSLQMSWSRMPLNLSPFHPVVRDFAFVIDKAVPAASVLQAVKESEESLIVAVQVFDLYEGLEENRKSLAISITIQPTEQPLTDKDIEGLSSRLIHSVFQATGAMLRGSQSKTLSGKEYM